MAYIWRQLFARKGVPLSEKHQPATPIIPALRRLLQLAGRHKYWLYLALIVDTVQAVLVVVSSHILRNLFDAVTQGDESAFFAAAILSLVLGLIGSPLSYVRVRSQGIFSERTLYRIRQFVAQRLNALPVPYLEERHSGDFLSVINADLAKLKNLTGNDLLSLIGQVSRASFALLYIITISWQLTLVSLVLTPLVFALLAKMSAPITMRTNEMQEEIGDLNSIAQDALGGLSITKSFNLVDVLGARFDGLNRGVIRQGISIARLRSYVDSISTVVGFSPFLIAFGFGGYLAVTGRMTFGSIFAFINLLNYVVGPLGQIPGLIANIGESIGAAYRVFEVLDHDLEREGGTVTEPPVWTGPTIRFEDTAFAYEVDTPVLRGVSLDIQPGENIAIVGPSGSGKSTLIKLLLGFYPVSAGNITLYGADINEWQLAAARKQMAFVAQDTYLFPVSVKENIACGRPGASQAEVEQAAIAANIHDFVLTLPEGYGTEVGERGARLSGGQRQRISLARAILKDAPILLLDEPTSALDSESEALVQEALDRMMAQHTSIVIAHRLSTIKNADRVLVLDEGRIVEQGTHAELLARGGLYQELYQKQFGLEHATDAPQGGEAV
jgi:ATP-binding cassette subfamily B protein